MKGVYFCEGIDFDSRANLGIINKINEQIKCLSEIGPLTVISTTFKKTPLEKILFVLTAKQSDREKQREKLFESVKNNTDYIYIRKPSLTINFYKILKRIKQKNPNIFIIMEIPTYPFHSEYTGISKVLSLKSARCEKKLYMAIDRIATYSNDDEIWGIKTIKLSNCVNYSKIRIRSNNYRTIDNTIRLTCVANYTYWHGIDRLIDGINDYGGNYEIVLNIVGAGREIEKLKKKSHGNENIKFLGPKSGKELDEIFDKTDIAVDALGRHRSGVYYNSSLKGKEYAARGIPEISSVTTEMDYIDNYKYYLKLPSDDSPINIEDVIAFFEKISQDDNVSKKIRDRTYRLFDYKYGFKERIFTELKGAE